MADMKRASTKWWIGGGIVAAGAVWWMYRKKQQASAAANTPDPNIDPNTGLPYSAEYGSGGSSPVGVTPSLYGYQDPFGNTITPGSGGSIVTAPSTNAAWAQQAESYLTSGPAGMNGLSVAAAIGKALGGLTLSQDEFNIVETAVGFLGRPPQGWPNGAPHMAPPGGQTGGGGVTTPSPPTGVHQVGSQIGSVGIAWNPVSGADGYRVYGLDGGFRDAINAPATSIGLRGLQGNTTYFFYVTSVTSTGKESLPSAPVMVRTSR